MYSGLLLTCAIAVTMALLCKDPLLQPKPIFAQPIRELAVILSSNVFINFDGSNLSRLREVLLAR
jgi:hypothetical protein